MGRTRGGPERHGPSCISALRMPFLPPEILTSIFRELMFMPNDQKNLGQFKKLRLVSKYLDNNAKPILFHTMTLNQRLVNWPELPDLGRDQILPILQAHAQEIRIMTELDWSNAVKLLSSCEKFKDLLWMHFTQDTDQLPHEIMAGFHDKWPHVRLHLSSTDYFSVSAKGLPTSKINTIRFTPSWLHFHNPELISWDLQLKDCVVSSPNLTHLTAKLLSPFDPSKGRLPPIKYLRIEGPSRWTYSLDDTRTVWDFSQLEAIYLDGLNFETFTSSVLPTDFPKLQSVQLYQKPTTIVNSSENLRGCILLAEFLKELPLLESITVCCYDTGLLISGFDNKTMSRVRKLYVRNYTQAPARTLKLWHHERIGETFPVLRDLFVEIEYVPRTQEMGFCRWERTRLQLHRLSTLKSLNTLHLSIIASDGTDSKDFDYKRMRDMVEEYFRPLEIGQPLRKLTIRQLYIPIESHARVWDYFEYYWDVDGRRYFLPLPRNGVLQSNSPTCITVERN